jgi:hypothetical protein
VKWWGAAATAAAVDLHLFKELALSSSSSSSSSSSLIGSEKCQLDCQSRFLRRLAEEPPYVVS